MGFLRALSSLIACAVLVEQAAGIDCSCVQQTMAPLLQTSCGYQWVANGCTSTGGTAQQPSVPTPSVPTPPAAGGGSGCYAHESWQENPAAKCGACPHPSGDGSACTDWYWTNCYPSLAACQAGKP